MSKAKWITFDVEAYRTRNEQAIAEVTAKARDKKPAQNTAKYLKERWDDPESIAEREQKAISDTAKNPLLAEVLFIACMTDDGVTTAFEAMSRGIEPVIRAFQNYLIDTVDEKTIWTGFNIKRYDLPLLLTEFRRQGTTPGDWFPKYYGRGWSGRIFDSMDRCPTLTPFVSLDDALLYHGIEAKTTEWNGQKVNGALVGEIYEAGDYETIERYCATCDVPNEDELYRAMTFDGTWGTYEDRDQSLREIALQIYESEMKPGQKWLSLVPALKSAGLLDREAA